MKNRSSNKFANSESLVHQLAETKVEARTSDRSLDLLFASSSIPEVPRVEGFAPAQLLSIERAYRALAVSPLLLPVDFTIDYLERVIALYLGQLIVETYGGEWGIYSGRHHVSSRVLPFLGEGTKVLDVFLFCMHLHRKAAIPGAGQSESLKRYYDDPQKFVIPV